MDNGNIGANFINTLGLTEEQANVIHTVLLSQEQRLTATQEQNALLQQHLAHLEQMIHNMPAPVINVIPTPTPPAPPAPAAATHGSRSVRGADPTTFNGDRSTTEEFIRALKLHIAVSPDSFADDKTKILYALSWMRGGTAEAWAQNRFNKTSEATFVADFDQFIKDLKAAFGDPNQKTSAQYAISRLKMTNNMSVADYTAQFEVLADRTEFNEDALVYHYKAGLLQSIHEKIHNTTTLPTTLQEWKTMAQNIDSTHRQFLDHLRSYTPIRPTFHRNQAQVPPRIPYRPSPAMAQQSSSGPAPMDIDHTERRRRYLAEVTCYRCGQKGHVIKNCPSPPKARI